MVIKDEANGHISFVRLMIAYDAESEGINMFKECCCLFNVRIMQIDGWKKRLRSKELISNLMCKVLGSDDFMNSIEFN